jgi:hypothetical protein
MPPKESQQPTPAEVARFVDWITSRTYRRKRRSAMADLFFDG